MTKMRNFILSTILTTMWTTTNNQLYRRFEFENFVTAFEFMTKVAALAEQLQHHPTWTNTYNVVEIWLQTHDAGNVITDKDREMAEAIDWLL